MFIIWIRAFPLHLWVVYGSGGLFSPSLHYAIKIVKSQCKVNLKNPICPILLWEKSNKITYLYSYFWWNFSIMSFAGDELPLISVLWAELLSCSVKPLQSNTVCSFKYFQYQIGLLYLVFHRGWQKNFKTNAFRWVANELLKHLWFLCFCFCFFVKGHCMLTSHLAIAHPDTASGCKHLQGLWVYWKCTEHT